MANPESQNSAATVNKQQHIDYRIFPVATRRNMWASESLQTPTAVPLLF